MGTNGRPPSFKKLNSTVTGVLGLCTLYYGFIGSIGYAIGCIGIAIIIISISRWNNE